MYLKVVYTTHSIIVIFFGVGGMSYIYPPPPPAQRSLARVVLFLGVSVCG